MARGRCPFVDGLILHRSPNDATHSFLRAEIATGMARAQVTGSHDSVDFTALVKDVWRNQRSSCQTSAADSDRAVEDGFEALRELSALLATANELRAAPENTLAEFRTTLSDIEALSAMRENAYLSCQTDLEDRAERIPSWDALDAFPHGTLCPMPSSFGYLHSS